VTRPFRVEALGRHDRQSFDCGVEPLNRYLHQQVGQDIRRRVTACFILIDNETERIAGYYTLAAGSVLLEELPEATARKLPRYPRVPVVRIGRLAVDHRYQGRKLGGVLLFDALKRSMDAEIAAFAAVVDAKDDRAVAFYEHHGFLSFAGNEKMLFLPFSEAHKRLGSKPK
jgi:ribosomal protein S18 acetylase RimI-like enzyme